MKEGEKKTTPHTRAKVSSSSNSKVKKKKRKEEINKKM